MNTNSDTKNLSPKKLKSYSLKSFRFFSKNLQPKTYHLKPSPHNLQPTTYHLQPNKGFTLVELLVTLSLFVVLTTIVLFSQQKFNGSILLTNLAYDVALTVRQAQTYGVNVRETSGFFDKAYGIYIDKQKDDKKFILFVEKVKNDGKYNGNINCKSSADTCLNSYSIKRGNKISDLRVVSDNCAPQTECSVEELNITFMRPNPDAKFKARKSTGTDFDDITEAKIILSSANGDDRNVLINSTGQISIGRGSGATCSTIGVLGATETFNYKGFFECYQVPVGASSVTITAYGAQGGNGYLNSGGLGGKATATFSVNANDVLNVYVGGVGQNSVQNTSANGGWNGGGGGGQESGSPFSGAGGGGASDVRKGSNKIIVAGGGGGGGGGGSSVGGDAGGAGGGYNGLDGSNGVDPSHGGKGGSQLGGGIGGIVVGGTYKGEPGGDGSLGAGGSGGQSVGSNSEGGGGGGGGGYYGGGGGGSATGWGSPGKGASGGGGGSSFIDSSAISGVSTQDTFNSGNGKIEITAY